MTDDETKYLVCPTPTWVGHTPDQNVEMTALQILHAVRAGRVVFESLGFGPVRVYGDFEKSFATMEEMHASRDAELQRCIAELTELNGKLTNIVVLDSCGYKKDPDPKKCGPMLSWHFILPGKGAYASPADVKRAGLVPFRKDEPKVWDQGVYPELGSQRLMRTLGANKPGENRPFLIMIDGKLTSLEELYAISEDVALLFFKLALIQNVEGETHYAIQKKEAPVVVARREENGKIVALGANGKPFGSDVKIVSERPIRDLCTMCGWFKEFNRSHQRWCEEMWQLQNIADDLGLGDQLDQLMMDVSKVWIGPHTDASVEGIRAVTKDRPTDMKRKNLGQLRTEAEEKNEGAYLLWVQENKSDKHETKDDVKRTPYLFADHNAFVGKEIEQKTADDWINDAIIMVMNGGESYFLTRDKKICEVSNKPFETWRHAKNDKLLQCLNVDVKIKNPKYDAEIAKIYEQKIALKLETTQEEYEKGRKYNFETFGSNLPFRPGFTAAQIYKRKLNWVREEVFIPHLARRIPDENIAHAVADKTAFNKFRGFPIENMRYNRKEGPQFIGSAWHRHLVQDICHGDMREWKHLEACIADMIQRPYRVSGVAHVFQSNQGTGKLHFSKFMNYLLGAPHVMTVTDMNIYMQKFNEDQGTAILKIFEEVRGKGEQFVNNDRLKQDITQTTVRIEVKGGAVLNIRHCARYWFLTNHRDTLHIEADDRRYVYHSISNEHANDWDYFEPIVAEINNWDYIRNCFEYFAELPYEEKFAMTAINTEYKNEQKFDSMTLPQKFIREFVEDGKLEHVEPMKKDDDRVSSETLYECYKTWCDVNTHSKSSAIAFWKTVLEIGVGPKQQMRIQGISMKAVNISKDVVLAGIRKRFKMPEFNWRTE